MIEMLRPDSDHQIPEETIKVPKAAFPNGNIYLTLRDTLGPLFDDQNFQDFYPALGQPAESPGRLALITVMQFLKDLSDRQAADAVRSRIDWKYILGLELDDPGFDFFVLSEFRQRLLKGKDQSGALPQKWTPRTPAMAAILTDHIWTDKELLTTIPLKC
jgi:transposase